MLNNKIIFALNLENSLKEKFIIALETNPKIDILELEGCFEGIIERSFAIDFNYFYAVERLAKKYKQQSIMKVYNDSYCEIVELDNLGFYDKVVVKGYLKETDNPKDNYTKYKNKFYIIEKE